MCENTYGQFIDKVWTLLLAGAHSRTGASTRFGGNWAFIHIKVPSAKIQTE